MNARNTAADTRREKRIQKSLRYSLLDGTFAASMIGFGESFLVPFAIFLKASNVQLGLLSSLPQALGSMSQLFTTRLLRIFGSRKKLVCTWSLLQGLMYLPIALTFYYGSGRVSLLLALACLYVFFGMTAGPAWNSWMGDLVDEKKRGDYFGGRNRMTGLASFTAMLLAGYILHLSSGSVTRQYAGFALIFSLALVSRMFSFLFLARKFEPAYDFDPRADFSFFSFLMQAWHRNYGLFVIYHSLMTFSVYMAAPFFAPYMLRDLNLDYATFTIINAAAVIAKLFSTRVWGKAADQFGNRRVLSLAGFLMPLIPLLWLFSRNVWYLILIQLYSGFVWGGFEIAAFNFVFDTTTPQKRATCVSYFNVINGAAIILGALTGTLVVRYNTFFWSKYLLVFALSTMFRYLVSLILIPRIREARTVDFIPYTHLFLKVISTMPTMGIIYHLIPFWKHTGKETHLSGQSAEAPESHPPRQGG